MKKRLLYCLIIIFSLAVINLVIKESVKTTDFNYNFLGILEFKFVKNFGMTFGIFEGEKYLIHLIELIMLLISFLFFFKIINKSEKTYYVAPIVLFLSGGIGNVFDRLINGYVTDYVRFNIDSFTFFNMDDVLVISGTLLFIYQSIFDNKTIGKIYSIK